jgi:AcrR family transcriptional regulator
MYDYEHRLVIIGVNLMAQKSVTEMNRRERRKEETRRKIIEVARRLFAEQGFDGTSMEQIAEETDIAKATLYSYFPVKEAIISAYMQSQVREFEPELQRFLRDLPDTRARLAAMADLASESAKRHRDILLIYYFYRFKTLQDAIKDPGQRSGLEDILAKIIQAGQESGEIRKDMFSEVLARHLEFMQCLTIIGWLLDPANCPLPESLYKAHDLFLNGAGQKSTQ